MCSICSAVELDAIRISSMYAKMKFNPVKAPVITRCIVCAAFLKPKVSRVNSNKPNGVIIAVLGISCADNGT